MDLLKQAQGIIKHRRNSGRELAEISKTSLSTINRIDRGEDVSEGTLLKVISRLSKNSEAGAEEND